MAIPPVTFSSSRRLFVAAFENPDLDVPPGQEPKIMASVPSLVFAMLSLVRKFIVCVHTVLDAGFFFATV